MLPVETMSVGQSQITNAGCYIFVTTVTITRVCPLFRGNDFLGCYEKHFKMKVDEKYNFLLQYYNVTTRSGDPP